MGLPVACRLSLALVGGAVFGLVTEIVAVRPVLKSLDQHLYVLSTLALALMVQQFTAIEWSTEPQPFPRLFDIARGGFDQQFWLPMLACAAVIVGLELLYRRTLIGHAFLAIAEDNFAARALGLPERSLRMASFCTRRRDRRACGLRRRQLLLAFFANAPLLTFSRLRAGRARAGMGNNRGAVVGGRPLLLFQQAANFLVGGIFASVAVFTVFISSCCAPEARRRPPQRRYDGGIHAAYSARCARSPRRARAAVPALLAIGCVPLFGGGYWA
jgi:branched-chain amino acid transport system permease protein